MDQATGDRSATAVDELKLHWRRHMQKALAQPYLMALLAGSLLLSFASFFTTFAGMLNFMPVWLITFCIVFAIQALLFVTSWRIGFAVADRERLPLFTGFVFLICLSTSVFFSWVALFERINDAAAQERTRTTRIHRAAEDVVTELQNRVLARQRQAVEALIAAPEYASWKSEVERVAQTAVEARDTLEASFRDAALETANRIAELEAERAGILSQGAAAEEMKEARERELTRLEESRPAQLARLEALSSDLAAAEEKVLIQEGLMQAEETGGAAGKGTGRGPVWRELRNERNIMEAKRQAQQALYDRQAQALADLDERIAATRAEIASAGATSGSARLQVIEQSIARLKGGEDSAVVDPAAGLEQAVSALRADLAAMSSQVDLAPLDRAAARCGELLSALSSQPSLAERTAGLSCDRGVLAAQLAPIRELAKDQAALASGCAAGGENAPVVSSLGFDAAVAFSRSCMDASGLPSSALADLRGEIARLVLEEAPDASQFVKTFNAWKSGDKLAYFALAIALFIDLLVLFSGLIGALSGSAAITQHFDRTFNRRKADNFVRSLTLRLEADAADSEELWTTRAILRNAEPYIGEERAMRGFTAQIDLDRLDDPNLKGAIRQFLLGLYTDKLAKPDKDAPATRFYLKTNVLDALRHHLFEGGSAKPDRRVSRALSAPTQRPALAAPVADAQPAPQQAAPRPSALRETPRRSAPEVQPQRPAASRLRAAPGAPEVGENIVQLRREAAPARAADSNVTPMADFDPDAYFKNINAKFAGLRAKADDVEGEDQPPRRDATRRPSASGEE